MYAIRSYYGKERNLNTAVDTAGNVGWEIFEEIIPYTDLFLFDVKLFSDSKHQKATGVRNAVILKNLRKLAELNQSDIWVRIPIIPSINDNISEMALVAEFRITSYNVCYTKLLRFGTRVAGYRNHV